MKISRIRLNDLHNKLLAIQLISPFNVVRFQTFEIQSMHKTGYLTTLLLITLLSGCHSTVKVSPLRYESPEVIGQGQHQAVITINPEQRVDVAIRSTADFANPVISTEQPASPPGFPADITITNIPIFEMAYWARDSLAYIASMADVASYAGINDKLDIYLDTQYGSPLVRMKYQFLGQPASRAKSGNLSLAIDGGYGYSYVGGLNGLEQNAYDAALIGGYRITNSLMLYGGPFYSRYDLKDANGSLSTSVESAGSNVGVRFELGKNSSIYLEKSTSKLSSGASIHTGDYYGLALESRR